MTTNPHKVVTLAATTAATSRAGDYVTIEWNVREAHVSLLGIDIYFRLIEGKYPNYNSIIPTDYAHEVSCQRTALLSAVKAVAPFAPDSSKLLKLYFEGDTLEVDGEDYDFSLGAKKSISTEGFEGDALSIGVKSSSMMGMLSKLSTWDVLLRLNDPSRAIIIEPIDDEAEETVTCLLMPMLINE